MKIYSSTEWVDNPSVGDLRLKVNSMWDYKSRSVCFRDIKNTFGGGTTVISYDVEECTEAKEGIVIGGTRKCINTKWKPAEITRDIKDQLVKDGYTLRTH